MVNRGRPSRDCLPCRRRKLRCNLQQPGCAQCKRAGISCPGYRSPSDLVLRDENDKARRKTLPVSHEQPSPSSLPLSWEEQARTAFFTIYVFGVSRSHDTVVALYRHAIPGSHLTECVDAVSLAFFAFHHGRNSKLRALSQTKYISALRSVSSALQDPEISLSDSTLQSVLLLDLCEKISNHDSSGPESWMAHSKGAEALISARGNRNYATATARRLARRASLVLHMSCNANSVRPPEALTKLYRRLEPFNAESDPKWRARLPVLKLVNLKADIREGTSSTSETLSRAWELDAEFQAMIQDLPPPVQVKDTSRAPLFGPEYDLYEDHLSTQGANVFRAMRLTLHALMRESLQCSGVIGQTQLKLSDAIMESMSQDICQSIPQYLIPGARPENKTPFSPVQIMQCYGLLPPLYMAGLSTGSAELRQRAVAMSDYMAENGGMELARRSGALLDSAITIPYWNAYAMLGGYAFAV